MERRSAPAPEGPGEDVEQARRGDRAAIDRLCALLRPELEIFVRRRLGAKARRWEQPEDVVQAVLLEMMGQLSTLPEASGLEEVRKRLYRTAGFRIKDALRNHGRRAGESVLPEAAREAVVPQPAMGLVTGRDYTEYLEALVDRLPPKYAEVVRLCAMEGMSFVEAARSLGLKDDTVRKRYEAARRALRERIRVRPDE